MPELADELFEEYKSAKDLYIIERLYGIIYSSYLISNEKEKYKNLKNKIVEHIDSNGFPEHFQACFNISHFLNELDEEILKKLLDKHYFTQSKANFDITRGKSQLYLKSITEECDRKIYETAFGKISSSLQDCSGDFYIYELRRYLDDWRNIKRSSSIKLEKEFELNASNYEHLKSIKFRRKLKAYKNAKSKFSTEEGRYLLLNKILENGYSDEYIELYDNDLRYFSRSNHKEERIGKKYQWIALNWLIYELSRRFIRSKSHAEGNFDFAKHREVFFHDASRKIKDIDLTFNFIHENPQLEIDVPKFKNPSDVIFQGNYANWLKEESLPDLNQFLRYQSGKEKYIILNAYYSITEDIDIFSQGSAAKDFMYLIHSCLIDKKDLEIVSNYASKKHLWNRWFPEKAELHSAVDLGEYYDSKFSKTFHDSCNFPQDEDETVPFKLIYTTTEISHDYASLDCSYSSYREALMPSPWIIQNLNLEHKEFNTKFYDRSGNLVAFDPCIWNKFENPALVFKLESLQQMLKAESKTILWTITGEKRYKDIGPMSTEFNGNTEISIFAWLDDDGNIQAKSLFNHNKPH